MTAKIYTAAALLTLASLISCSGNKDKEVVDKSIIPAGTEATTVQPVATNASNTATTTNANMVPTATTTVPVTTITPGVTSGTVNFKPPVVNPTQQQNVVTTAPQTTMVSPATTTVTAPGMNPPHGQPGHRCDINVGAPLNSKPAPANVQPVVTTTTPAPTQPSNVTVKEVPNTVKTAPGMNPPHGEPGHRCEISVGAPLNSKPAAPAPTNTPPTLLTAPKNDTNKN